MIPHYFDSFRIFLQETYELEDLYLYDTLTSDKGYWVFATGVSTTFTDNGLRISANTDGERKSQLNITYPSNYCVECEIVALDRTSDGYITELCVEGVGLNSDSSNKYIFQLDRWVETVSQYNGALNTGDIIRFEYIGGTVSVYQNNTLIGVKSRNSNFNGFIINQYNRRGITFKNLKIKQL